MRRYPPRAMKTEEKRTDDRENTQWLASAPALPLIYLYPLATTRLLIQSCFCVFWQAAGAVVPYHLSTSTERRRGRAAAALLGSPLSALLLIIHQVSL